MKLIDVLQKLSKGEIKNGTILIIDIDNPSRRQYKYRSNAFLDDYNFPIDIYGENCLNQEVKLMEPKNIRYYLKLVAEDDDSYVVRSSYSADFNYDFGGKSEICEFQTKFTQAEIDNDKFLKFIEQHGIKEEVE